MIFGLTLRANENDVRELLGPWREARLAMLVVAGADDDAMAIVELPVIDRAYAWRLVQRLRGRRLHRAAPAAVGAGDVVAPLARAPLDDPEERTKAKMNIELRDEWLQNTTFDELSVGQTATMRRALTDADIAGFAAISGDLNPTHLDEAFAQGEGLAGRTAHGMWSGALISTVLGTVFPGPGTRYVSQRMDFHGAARAGDVLDVEVRVTAKDAASGRVSLDCEVRRQDGHVLMDGEAVVDAPRQKQRVRKANGLRWHVFDAAAGVRGLIEQARAHAKLRCAVVHPCDAESLRGALDAGRHGLFAPVLVAPRERLLAIAAEAGLDLSDVEIVDVPHSHAAAERAAEMAAAGSVQALMKGSLHTDELMERGGVGATAGCAPGAASATCFVMDVPAYDQPLLVTDAAINIAADARRARSTSSRTRSTWRTRWASRSAQGRDPRRPWRRVNPKMPSHASTPRRCARWPTAARSPARILDGPLALRQRDHRHGRAHQGASTRRWPADADILVVPDLDVRQHARQAVWTYLAGADGRGHRARRARADRR
ncbi:MAG: bifunctional enoyl-CoA hydratase/phosphate acetyltransferase [Comamonadaceae bacterium]|nr:bifunctional enoyl-CoA hydratase/phosphate acetyltransferase [Comamonadaceae bacterium]